MFQDWNIYFTTKRHIWRDSDKFTFSGRHTRGCHSATVHALIRFYIDRYDHRLVYLTREYLCLSYNFSAGMKYMGNYFVFLIAFKATLELQDLNDHLSSHPFVLLICIKNRITPFPFFGVGCLSRFCTCDFIYQNRYSPAGKKLTHKYNKTFSAGSFGLRQCLPPRQACSRLRLVDILREYLRSVFSIALKPASHKGSRVSVRL